MTPQITVVLAAVAVLAVLISAEIWRELHTFKVTKYEVKSAAIPETGREIRIIFLSDLHNREYGRDNDRLYHAVLAERPDLILIGGDMLVGKDGIPYEPALDFVRKLPSVCPVYYANGNHEQRMKEEPEMYSQCYADYKEALIKAGVRFLENESRIISVGDTSLELCAIELPLSTYRKLRKSSVDAGDVARLAGSGIRKRGRKTDCPYRILLAHNPSYMQAYMDWGADLILSGHLHGGLVRVPGLGGVISPQFRLFPEYSGELTLKNGHTAIVSRGLGTHTIHLRLFNTPELISISLTGRKSKKSL